MSASVLKNAKLSLVDSEPKNIRLLMRSRKKYPEDYIEEKTRIINSLVDSINALSNKKKLKRYSEDRISDQDGSERYDLDVLRLRKELRTLIKEKNRRGSYTRRRSPTRKRSPTRRRSPIRKRSPTGTSTRKRSPGKVRVTLDMMKANV